MRISSAVLLDRVALVMPASVRSTTAPPEFPGWIGVEICMYLVSFRIPARRCLW